MPNWCNNLLIVESGNTKFDLHDFWTSCRPGYLRPDATLAKKVVASLEPSHDREPFSFKVLAPAPKDLNRKWREWAVANWGTKWDADIVESEEGEDMVKVYFLTAWSPAIAWFKKFIEKHPEWNSTLVYAEEGAYFAGAAEYIDGTFTIAEAEDGTHYNFLSEFGVGDWWPEEAEEED